MFSKFTSTAIKRCAFGSLFAPIAIIACSAIGNERGQDVMQASNQPDTNEDGGPDAGQEVPETGTGDEVEFETGMPVEEIDHCAQTGSKAEPIQLDIIVLLDRSGSMYGNNWNGATAALKQFVQDPASDGINVGLLYFPIDNPSDGLICNSVHYQNLAVPIGALPTNAQALVDSIDGELPNGGSTPMYGALEGTLWAARQQQLLTPNHKIIVVFASDGDPNSCPTAQNNIPTIASLAQETFDTTGIQTFVIAITGASVYNLDQIASAGGTIKAYDVTGNIAEFSLKMADIRATALSCEYEIPEPPGNEPFELDKVVVKHIADDGTAEEIPKADGELDCGPLAGWYFDDPAQPKKIKLCPESCNQAKQDTHGQIEVFFGCMPKLN